MDIIEYYKIISSTLEDFREKRLLQNAAGNRIKRANMAANASGLDVYTSIDILNNLDKFDEERSYDDSDFSYDSEMEDEDPIDEIINKK